MLQDHSVVGGVTGGGLILLNGESERSCNSALPSLEVDALLFCLTPQCLLWLPVWCLQVSVTLY